MSVQETHQSPQSSPVPIYSGKCNVTVFESCNPRKIVDHHVNHLVEEMRTSVKDMQHPIFACVPSFESATARTRLAQQETYPCKIIVSCLISS
jgi:hypothetical protein